MRTSLRLAIQAARRSALWTEDGGMFNSRAMARRPNRLAVSFFTSTARPLMVAAEDALRRSASLAGQPSPTPRWRKHPARRQSLQLNTVIS